jgi:N-acetylglucosaminyl-diphospho-decaprenol L-rhamnosyltransferase
MNEFSTEKIAIIIVDFYKARSVVENVTRIEGTECVGEIIVIDNSNDDGNYSVLMKGLGRTTKVTIKKFRGNIGYTKACNAAAAIAKFRYLLFLSPDISITESVLDNFIRVWKNTPNPGVIGCSQMNPDGTSEPVARAFPSLWVQIAKRIKFLRKIDYIERSISQYEFPMLETKFAQEVPWLQSSVFFTERQVWDSQKGFDESFFLFMADTDFCYRLHVRGLSVLLMDIVGVQADGIRASAGGGLGVLTNKIIRLHLIDALKYYMKHW